jgi:hypothetical protein
MVGLRLEYLLARGIRLPGTFLTFACLAGGGAGGKTESAGFALVPPRLLR